MKKGDLVIHNNQCFNQQDWGRGVVLGFVDSGMPNHLPWAVVHWGKWNKTSQGPVTYFKVINENR